jgi:NitT/TauT family transport system substrate-binding protein
VTRRDVLDKRRDELEAMTRAVYRTLGWFAKTAPVDIARTLSRYFPDVPTELFAQCIERYRRHNLWASDPVVRREGYDRLHAAMRSANVLTRDISFNACVDTALAEQAMR